MNTSEYSSKIKDIYFELPDFTYSHGSTKIDDAENESGFIGRDAVIDKVKTLVGENSSSPTGAYLISGFRGMGKTSMVNRAIYEAREEASHKKIDYHIIELSLAQESLTDTELLKQMAHKVKHCFEEPSSYKRTQQTIFTILGKALFFIVAICLSSLIYSYLDFLLLKRLSNITILEPLVELIRYFNDVGKKLMVFGWEMLNPNFLIFAFVFFHVFRWLARTFMYGLFKLMGFYPNYYIKSRINRLLERINSKITEDNGRLNFSGFWQNLNPLKRKQKEIPLASAKDIEYELLYIFNLIKIHNSHLLFNSMLKYPLASLFNIKKQKFIFVFDELDKIEPHYNASLVEKDSENPYDNFMGSESLIKRQEAIYKLLSNLKHFLNTANAKFVFIAGREMFDASLADVSDRDSFLSSIFHDTIYLKSFLKDKLLPDYLGITTITEAFVCQMLLPNYNINLGVKDENQNEFWKKHYEFLPEVAPKHHELFHLFAGTKVNLSEKRKTLYAEMNLKTYKKYLDWIYNQNGALKELSEDVKERQKEKAIMSLSRFIIYLTYRSNGTPKKLRKLFEDYITTEPRNNNIFSIELNEKSEKTTTKFYLRHKFNDQYKFGLIHSIFRPYYISKGKHLKALGDKQLVSTSFLLDYIFKFHSIAFNYRNFELTPELIAFNKSPELRNFIESLISFLSYTHVREVQNGLNQFKFNRRTAQEITYLSKISEVESAAFNFSLDESMLVKRHYNRKLKELIKMAQIQNYQSEGANFVYSVGFVNEILGDLHFYDQEFDDAMIHYSNTIQHLRKVEDFSSYNQPTKLLQLMLLLRIRLKMCLALEKMKSFGTAFTSAMELCEMVQTFSVEYTRKELMGNVSATLPEITEATRLMIQPFIQKIFLSEKGSFGPITLRVFANAIQEIEQMAGKERECNDGHSRFSSYIMLSTFYRDLGSLMFYKNGAIYDDLESNLEPNSLLIYRQLVNAISDRFPSPNLNKIDRKTPVAALAFYMMALNQLVNLSKILINKEASEIDLVSLYQNIARLYPRLSENVANTTLLSQIGDILSRIGDTLLCFSNTRGSTYHLYDTIKNSSAPDLTFIQTIYPQNTALKYYHLSSLYHRKSGRTSNEISQYKKILYIIINGYALSSSYSILAPYLDNAIMVNVIAPLLQSVSWTNEISDRFQISKYRSIFKIHDPTYLSNNPPGNKDSWIKQERTLNTVYNSLSATPDIQEALTAYFEIKHKLGLQKFSLKDTVVNPYSVVDSRFVRIQQLNFKCKLNFNYLNKLGFTAKLSRMGDDQYRASPPNIVNGYLQHTHEFWDRSENPFFDTYWNSNHNNWALSLVSAMVGKDIFDNKTLDQQTSARISSSLRSWIVNRYEQNENLSVQRILNEIAQQCTLFDRKETEQRIAHYAKETLLHLISDSIFCMYDCIKTIEVFGPSHTVKYSYLGHCHEKMGDWCKYYRLALRDYQAFEYKRDGRGNVFRDTNGRRIRVRKQNELKKRVAELIGENNAEMLDPNMHYELAIQNYYKAIHVHSEGNEYNTMINNMYYLEDGFNDGLDHFSAAMERWEMNTGTLRARINELKRRTQNGSLFYPDRYSPEINLKNYGAW